MEEPWDSAGRLVQSLGRRQEVQHLWHQLAHVLEALGQTLVDACHDMEQLSGDGPLQRSPDFQVAFESRVLATLVEATTSAGDVGGPTLRQPSPARGATPGTQAPPAASALP